MKIIIEDTSLLSQICGYNDKNLKFFEEALGAPIFCQGNELHLSSDDTRLHELFNEFISRMKNLVLEGHKISHDLVRGVMELIVRGDEHKLQSLESAHVSIPMSGQKVFPRSFNQANFLRGISKSVLSFGLGPAGTGKTYLSIAVALREVLSKRKKKLVLTRPVVEAGESLGFLPGDLSQKISPYLRPLYDAIEDLLPMEMVSKLEENRMIEIAPLAYMRGRSLKDCFIVLDEAQNTTKSQMKMFLTRIGEGAQAVVTGDTTQIDLPTSRTSGLLHAQKILSGIEDIHFTQFHRRDVVRHPLVKQIIEAYENE